MLNSIISGTEITVPAFFICTVTSLLLGLGAALLCMYKNRYSQSFAITLALLPAMVQVVIMLVNGNIGAGVAVAGAFGLVRFRSAPGSAREIGLIFLAVTLGIATGMGYARWRRCSSSSSPRMAPRLRRCASAPDAPTNGS